MFLRRSSTRHLTAAAVLLVALAGCTAPAPATPTSEPLPSESGEPATTQPTALLGLGCDDILGVDEARSWTTDAVHIVRDETSAVTGPDDVALAQRGGLDCVWGEGDAPATGYIANQIAVQVARLADSIPARELSCSVGGGPERSCDEVRELGDLRVSVSWGSLNPTEQSAPAEGVMSQIVDTIASRLTGSVAAPWTAPDASYTGDAFCGATVPAKVATALGVPASAVTAGDAAEGPSLAFTSLGGATCGWSAETRWFAADTVPGGAWVWDSPRTPAGLPGVTAIEVTGADDAVASCSTDTCVGYLSVSGAFVELRFPAPDVATFATQVTSVLG